MEGAAVKLIIKAANQQIKDQVVRCDLGWTIGRLKDHLSEVYPSKPESSCQKLIYLGQLLKDTSCLKDVLRQCDGQEDQGYTVHLVCAPNKTSAKRLTLDDVRAILRTSSEANRNNAEHIRVNSTSSAQTPSQDTSNTVTQNVPTQLYSAQQYFDPRNSQQIAWMQQAYTHYFTQYMQLMAAQGIQLQTSIPYMQQMNINTTESVQNPYANNVNNNIGDEQPQAAVQNAAAANAENDDAAEEDAAFNQDWLDFFYRLSKTLVLFSIVYFHSSPIRFFIVTVITCAMFLYQDRFRVQAILVPGNNNARADNNNQMLQNDGQRAQQQNGQALTAQAEATTDTNEEHEEERPGPLAFTWTFFSSFFASLIPDQANVM